jgi:uncharacterized caspase-like protein
MKCFLLGAALATLASAPAWAQADGCRGAVSALNRVKEEITPDLGIRNKAKDEFAVERVRTMFSTMVAATRVCTDQPELLYYRAILARETGDKDLKYYERKLRESGYQPSYDPFAQPPAAHPAEADTGLVAQKWALVVGINQFKDARAPKLRFAAKDSADFVHYLTDPKGGRFQAAHVKCLTNDQATIQSVKEGLGWLRVNVKPSDLVVVYLSSHGSERDSDPNGVSYVILNDTDLSSPEKLYATSLQMIDLVQTLNREIKARRVVLFLDTCYSGDASHGIGGSKRVLVGSGSAPPPAAAPSSQSFSPALENLKTGVGRAVITASSADEVSWEDETHQNGYFTHYLLDALSAGKGESPLGEVFPRVRDQVLASVTKDHQGQRQTPTSQFSEQAESIVIGVATAN